jgi:hypothetical protein
LAIEDKTLSEDEITRRMDAAVRRALSTPPTQTKELIGKSERAIARRESRVRKKKNSKSNDQSDKD